MKIEPGFYKCRNGCRARVLCVDAPAGYPVVGYLIDDRGGILCTVWNPAGRYLRDKDHEHDLIEPWRDESDAELVNQLRDLLRQMESKGVSIDVEALVAQVEAAVTKQPVRVSGWVNVYKDGTYSDVVHLEQYRANLMAGPDRIACVYVTGTEGVGPGISSQGNEGEGQ